MPVKRKFSRAIGSSQGAAKKPKYSVATTKFTGLSTSNRLLRTKQQVVLRYSDSFALNPTTGGFPASKNFRATSLTDPDYDLGGHQPRGFDQLMSLYGHYFVDEVLCEVFFDFNSTRVMLGYINILDNADLPNRIDAMETRVGTQKLLTHVNSGEGGYLKITCKPNEFLGLPKHDGSMKGNASSSPDADVYFCVGTMPIDNLVDTGPTNCVVKLTYKCTLIEPKEPSSS